MSVNSDTSRAGISRPGIGLRPGRGPRIVGMALTGIWLVYLISPIAALATSHHSVPYVAGGLVIIFVFCAVYLIVVPRWITPRRHTSAGLGLLAVLAVVFGLFYGQFGAFALWIFVASASGLLVRQPRWALRAVAGCIAGYTLFSWITHTTMSNYLGSLLPAAFIGFAMIGLRRQVELTIQLTQAREEVAELAANEERLRLARDMHDLTGQSLSTITLKSELAARLLGRLPASVERDRARDEAEQVAAVSRQTLRDIREAISGYRRPTLAVELITARAALTSAGITTRDDPELTLLSGTFDPEAEAALAWCLREAVTNVIRHSGAQNCLIKLDRRGERLSLTVRDDGTGHVPPVAGRASAARGSGLHGMSERLSAAGGTLELRGDMQPGFCLVATVPDVARADNGAEDRAGDRAGPPAPAVRPGQATVTE